MASLGEIGREGLPEPKPRHTMIRFLVPCQMLILMTLAEALKVRYFETPMTVTPQQKFRYFKFSPNPLKILHVYFWGD